MITGPKYKIARRLGAPIFEKTQTQKYVLHTERRGKKRGFSKPKSEYGIQMNEKQKARFTYGLSERQFSNYVKAALEKKSTHAVGAIFHSLESRLDNVVYRLGLSKTRLGSRQMVSHGHILVNGRRGTAPSRQLVVGDTVEIRAGSLGRGIFANLEENLKNTTVPSWISFDITKKTAKIVGAPLWVPSDNMFDLNAVVEFYSR